MAVVRVNELRTRSLSVNYKRERTLKRTFQIYTNNPLDDQYVALAGLLFVFPEAALGFAYESPTGADFFLRVASQDITQHNEDPQIWVITLNYQSKFDSDPQQGNDNPLLRPPIKKWNFSKGDRAVRFDLNNAPLVNSAKDAFSPPITVFMPIQTLTIEYNRSIPSTDPVFLNNLIGGCNDAPFLGYPAGQVLCEGIQIDEVFEQQLLYYKLTYNFAIAPKIIDDEEPTWAITKIADLGYAELIAGKRKLIRDAFGALYPNPSRLNGAGLKLVGDDTAYLDFVLYRSVSYAGVP